MKTPIEIALGEYATEAILGERSNPRILEYFDEIGEEWVTNDDTAWCAAFLNWILMKAGKQQTHRLNARSFLTYGTHTDKPEVGDIVVLWRIEPESIYGHCGLYVTQTTDKIYILGGNQSGEVCIKAYPKSQLLDYRKI